MSSTHPAPVLHDVTSLTHDGRGVARVAGKALFIAGALPGERVTVRNVKVRRHFDEAAVQSIEQSSPERVTPRCAHFNVCGGCSLQHLDPGAQILAKQQHLLEELKRTGRVRPARVLEPLVDSPWNYRRRARLGARYVAKKGRVVVGFRERSAPLVADLKRCEILARPVDGLIEPLAEMLTTLEIRARVPQVEVAVADNAIALVFRVLQTPSAEDRERLREFGRRFQLQVHLQEGGLDSTAPLDDAAPLVYGLPEFGLELTFRPTDFIQVNPALNRRLITRAIELLDTRPQDAVLDLYSGLGNFTLPLARQARQVLGIEGDLGLIQRARENARRNGIANVEFHAADLTAIDAQMPWTQRAYARVLLDPPRVGAGEAVLRLIDRCGARRVAYVSCHPGSLARDSAILVEELGFQLDAAGVIDMFPHTSHVESVALFAR
ncbi:MAG TPA: 23S rRNA (uracil(1939)-C(5))-methyltransferase RlmD [Steroidobacteraceae bacterium]|nr:23S rRNA (uracil(1939)-C(5))-methyltransferase RlmD [Steroidobacteraceae bacterium]